MSLLQSKKTVLVLFLFILIGAKLFALSISYTSPVQAFDSQMRIRAFGNVGRDQTNWDFGYFGTAPKTELPEVYVEIYGPGKQIYQHYGHVGIVLEFGSIGRLTFDYGVFNTAEPGFALNFIHGNLFYYLWCHRNYQDSELRNEGRSNKYYKLKLTDEQKIQLVDFLIYNAKNENKYYLYKFFTDNCSTRVRDILDKIYDGALSKKYSSIPCGTYRQVIEKAIRPYKAIEIAYNILYGSVQDKKISYYDAFFLPEYLEIAINELSLGELARENDYPVIYAKSVEKGKYLQPDYLFYLPFVAGILVILFLAGYFGKKKKNLLRITGLVAFIIESIFSILSIISLYAQAFTIHTFMWFNYNIIFINPLMAISAVYSLLYCINPQKFEKKFADWHKILSSLIVVAFIGKLFYRQVNLYLIIFFMLFYHIIISSFPEQNKDNRKTFNFILAKCKNIKKLWKR